MVAVADGVAGAAPGTQDHAADLRALMRAWYPDLAVPAAGAPGGGTLLMVGEYWLSRILADGGVRRATPE